MKKTAFKRFFSALRMKKGLVALLIGILIIPTSFVIAEIRNDETPYPAPLYAQCFDGKDNDGDGKIDLKDIDCPKCSDGIDNDKDGLIDEKDPDCPKQNKSVLNAAAAALLFGDPNKTFNSNTPFAVSAPPVVPPPPPTPLPSNVLCARISVFRKTVRVGNSFEYQYEFYCDNTPGAPEVPDITQRRGARFSGTTPGVTSVAVPATPSSPNNPNVPGTPSVPSIPNPGANPVPQIPRVPQTPSSPSVPPAQSVPVTPPPPPQNIPVPSTPSVPTIPVPPAVPIVS